MCGFLGNKDRGKPRAFKGNSALIHVDRANIVYSSNFSDPNRPLNYVSRVGSTAPTTRHFDSNLHSGDTFDGSFAAGWDLYPPSSKKNCVPEIAVALEHINSISSVGHTSSTSVIVLTSYLLASFPLTHPL